MRRSLPRLLGLLPLLAALALTGCDTDGYNDNDTIIENDVFVLNFDLRDFDREFSDSGDEVQYEDRFDELTRAAVDDGIVLLYASDVTDEDGLRREGWTALPLTLGFDEDGDAFVDYTLTTTYTYDIDWLYVNLVASDDVTIDFLDDETGLLDTFERVRFKLVILPAGGFARGLDYSDYEAVKRAYNLPD